MLSNGARSAVAPFWQPTPGQRSNPLGKVLPIQLMRSSFFIVADRGNMKAYRSEKILPERPPRVQLVQAFTLTNAHLRPNQIFTDQAGAKPSGNLGVQTSTTEKHLDIETNRRLTKQLATHINETLEKEQPDTWSFAAPSEIHEAVLQYVVPEWRKRLAEQVPADLVNTPAVDLLGHFSAVRAA